MVRYFPAPVFTYTKRYRKRHFDTFKKTTGKLLDFGCVSKTYKKYFSHTDAYIGLDIEQSGHLHTNEQIDVFYDGKKIPFEENYFDSVFSSEVFEHVF
jgi:hypothetical protein